MTTGQPAPANDLHAMVLSAFLLDPDGTGETLATACDRLTASGTAEGIVPLTQTALATAARRRFGSEWSRADVIRYVAALRAMLSADHELFAALDPLAAENELRRVLGDAVAVWPDATATAKAWLMLLASLVAGLELDDAAVADLLDEAGRSATAPSVRTD